MARSTLQGTTAGWSAHSVPPAPPLTVGEANPRVTLVFACPEGHDWEG